MRERPILFNTEMVQAILDGRKSQTRRLIKLRNFRASDTSGYDYSFRDKRMLWNEYPEKKFIERKCSYGKVGDRLYIKENFEVIEILDSFVGTNVFEPYIEIKLKYDDGTICNHYLKGKEYYSFEKWKRKIAKKSKLLMFKSMARYYLETTGLRVEKINQISDNDIIAEGFETRDDFYGTILKINKMKNKEDILNKWAWVVDFKRIEK